MNHTYISDRKIEQIVADYARKHGITHASYSDGWVHTFSQADKTACLVGNRWSINDAAASAASTDKVAAYELLSAANVPAVKHQLVRKYDRTIHWPQEYPAKFLLKPLRGGSGKNITLCHNTHEAEAHIKKCGDSEWAISRLTNIEREIRLVALDGECLLAYEKLQPVTKNGVPFFNLSAGAKAHDIEPTELQLILAISAAHALKLRLAAVDIVFVDGAWLVLETNDGFMLEHYLRQTTDNYTKAASAYEAILIASLS